MHPDFAISPAFLLSRYRNMTCPVSSYLKEYSSLLSQQVPVPVVVGIKVVGINVVGINVVGMNVVGMNVVGINVDTNEGMSVCPVIPSHTITEMYSNLLLHIYSTIFNKEKECYVLSQPTNQPTYPKVTIYVV